MKKYVEKIHLIPTAGVTDQTLTVSNAVAELAALDEMTTHVLMSVATANVRFTIDGSDPSGTNGHVWPTTWSRKLCTGVLLRR